MNQTTTTIGPAVAPTRGGGFRHEAVLYAGVGGLVSSLVPWMHAGLASGETVVALVTGRSGAALKEALGSAGARVYFADMGEAGRNPARIISVWRRLLADLRTPGRPVRAVGEPVWPGRGPDELLECRLHESLVNPAFAGEDALWLKCPYDVSALDADVVGAVGSSHPVVDDASGHDVGTYHGHPDPADVLGAPLPPPERPPVEEAVTLSTLRPIRESVRARAEAAGLSGQRVRDLVLAVVEASSNSIMHGGGRGTLRSWSTPTTLVHEVTDSGHIDDVLVGRFPPPPDQIEGRGLWLVNELCDLVQLRSSLAGTVLRMHMYTH
jgi:anti-sigma regulatory factor (Ser/Thr protein kinase)